ncbi:MAG: GHMP kinase [Cenarchaeum symbiont of Oopsacas minuta]|nr:GHMP kinase [Cenarchaeum symbiont of Oopsacas minuta]
MIVKAFCPAHLTGFFMAKKNDRIEETGSLGAGFSIQHGVSTSVEVDMGANLGQSINVSGYSSPDTQVSKSILDEYRKRYDMGFVNIDHKITVPVGYGFGCSAAAAFSLSIALNAALGSPLTKEEEAGIAHKVDIECKTGLGDVLGAYHGGFEMRYRAGSPGIGCVEKIQTDSSIVIACFSRVSTEKFITERLESVDGLGGRMLEKLVQSKCRVLDFQDMSLEFAEHIGVMTPKIRYAVDALHKVGIKCGVALFGETVFAMVDPTIKELAARTLERLDGCQVIRSQIDNDGARLQTITPVISNG